MGHYGEMAKVTREAKQQRLLQAKADRPKLGKKQCVNAHNEAFDSNPAINEARANIPANINISEGISDLWNMDFNESLLPFPNAMEEPSANSDIITIKNKKVDLQQLSNSEREAAINEWQLGNGINATNNQGPSGFIFGLQEINLNQKGKAGDLEKTGHNLFFDRACGNARAAILASKNLSVFLDTDLTTRDCAIAKFVTGIPEMPEVYIASLYCDIEIKKEEDYIPKNLIKCIKRCQKNNFGFLCYGDLNAHSHRWLSVSDNARGKYFEENLLVKYSLNVLNNTDTPTYYGVNTDGTIVDVTMASANMLKYCRNWHNRDGACSSDHSSLEHTLMLGTPLVVEPKFKFRAAKESDWFAFRNKLEEKLENSFPREGSYEEFENKNEFFYQKINEALDETIAKTRPQPLAMSKLAKCDHWYDKKCKQLYKRIRSLRTKIRRAFKKSGKTLDERLEPHYELTEARREYWAYIKKRQHKCYKEFVESREGSSQMGSFNRKILKNGTNNAAIPLFKRAEGTTMTPDETVGTILAEHFPNCRDEIEQAPFIQRRLAKESQATFDINAAKVDFLTLEKVTAVMDSFEPLKGVGSDRIPPIVYQKFGERAYSWLHSIYKATYSMGLLPKTWLDVSVLFIPKAGKPLCEPRSWRPISLMQYQMKGLEKLLIRENEGNYVRNQKETAKVNLRPLHLNQHGFRKSRSCISSLSSKIGRIEKALVDHAFALAVYLDIKGAFDHVTNGCITQACRNKGCKAAFIEWFSDFFNNRSVNFEFKGKKYKRYCAMGTPQGSTASPYFWNAIADELHESIDDLGDVASEGFADDTCFVIIGDDIDYIRARMQRALTIAEAWAKDHNLEFSSSKTKVILYTYKTKFDFPEPLKMGQENLEYATRVKHLGVWLDPKLDFRYHLSEKIKEGKSIIGRLKGSMGKLWGLKPSMALWVYKMVARPIVAYASLVWSKIVHSSKAREDLKKFQAFALNQMGYFRKNTPPNAIEVVTGTMPLDQYILYDSMCSYLRTRGHEKYIDVEMYTRQPKLKGHR